MIPRKLGLLEIERLNSVTKKKLDLMSELARKERQGRNPRVCRWRHEYSLEKLRTEINLLEKKRTLMLQGYTNNEELDKL